MKRYSSTPSQERFDGKRVYRSTIYPPIPPGETDLMVVSNEGDYLDTLAYKYYGDPTLFWVIANVNNLGRGRFSVPEGLTLRIPTNIGEIINKFSSVNA